MMINDMSEPDAPDKPPVLLVTTIIIVSFLSVFGTWYFSDLILFKAADEIEETTDVGMADPRRLEYIQKETDLLTSYDKLEGPFFRIPIQEAMKKTIQNDGDV